MKSKIGIAFILTVMLVIITGCSSFNLEGKWKLSGETAHKPFNFVKNIEFKNDGTIITDSNSFPYTEYEFDSNKDENGNMTLIFKGNGSSKKYYLKEQKNNPEKIYLTNSDHSNEFKDMILIKQ